MARARCRSTISSTAPGAASDWRSIASASRSRIAIARKAFISCVTSIPMPTTRPRSPRDFSRNSIRSARATKSRRSDQFRIQVKDADNDVSQVNVLSKDGSQEKSGYREPHPVAALRAVEVRGKA